MPVDLLRTWGLNVAAARKRAGLTQTQFAERIGSTQQWVSTIERGGAEPRTATRLAISDALGVPDAELFPLVVA